MRDDSEKSASKRDCLSSPITIDFQSTSSASAIPSPACIVRTGERLHDRTEKSFLADFSAIITAFPDLPDFVLTLFEHFAERSSACFNAELPGTSLSNIAESIDRPDFTLPPSNPPQEGRAYYLNKEAKPIRKLPDFGVPNDNMEDSKEFFQCTKPSFLSCTEPDKAWLFGLFCMQHGTCVGGKEGLRDVFAVLLLYVTSFEGRRFWYDWSCGLR